MFGQITNLSLQLAVTFFLLYQQVNVAFLPGVALTLLLIPINRAICQSINKYSTKMMTSKDERIKEMSEALKGIAVIKYFLWEQFFIDQVHNIR